MADEPGPVRELADGPGRDIGALPGSADEFDLVLFTGRSPPGNLLRQLRAGQRRGEVAA